MNKKNNSTDKKNNNNIFKSNTLSVCTCFDKKYNTMLKVCEELRTKHNIKNK